MLTNNDLLGFKGVFMMRFITLALLCFYISYAPKSFGLSGVKVLSDIAYGDHEDQVLDVYIPGSVSDSSDAPVILMVHGGAWRIGDKSSKSVVKNKMDHWVKKGFIFISINYRMLPDVRPVRQAKDVEAALIYAQKHAQTWGGSSSKFILMGHSAGAHLVSLVTSHYDVNAPGQIEPWLGTVAIDSAAYDIVKIMRSVKPPRFYKKAFGLNPGYWKKASPIYSLKAKIPPFLAICSMQRKDKPCDQAETFIKKARQFGSEAKLLKVDLSHRATNVELGKNRQYTQAVDDFLRTLY